MIPTGPMALKQPQPADLMEPYFTGTQPDGGLWTDLARLSAHDHSGGLLGNPVAVVIPDGSITAADLDPSVLAPYALVDGTKPFSGGVTLQADVMVRDELFFGEQGTFGIAQASLKLTAPGVLGLNEALAGQGQTVPRLAIGATGTVSLTPNAGQFALVAGTPAAPGHVSLYGTTAVNGANRISFYDASGDSSSLRRSDALPSGGGFVFASQSGDLLGLNLNALFPTIPGTANLGSTAHPFATVYATTGTIQPSSRTVKAGVAPLDPAQAMAAVRSTPAVTFDYLPPERPPDWHTLPDDPAQAEAVLQHRLTAGPQEAAARHQAGFVAEDADPLFLVGEGQSSPSNTAGILLAALQNLDSRLAALETP